MLGMKLGLNRGDQGTFARDSLKALYTDTEFTDVTLACEGGRQLRAHKNILSSGSGLLREILRCNPHPHPLVYLRVGHDHLTAILRFIYLGHCQVDQGDIEEFLEIARQLRVAGLTKEDDNKDAKKVTKEKENKEKETKDRTAKEMEGKEVMEEPTDAEEDIVESALTKEKDDDKDEDESHGPIDINAESEQSLEEMEVENSSESVEAQKLRCIQCVYETDKKSNLSEHKETVHGEQTNYPLVEQAAQFKCAKCGVEEYCSASLKVHMRKKHPAETPVQKQPSGKQLADSTQDLLKFLTYVTLSTGQDLEEVVAGADGLEVAQELLLAYLASFRLKGQERGEGRPTVRYLTKVKYSIALMLRSQYRVDLVRTCPDFRERWKEIVKDLPGQESYNKQKNKHDRKSMKTELDQKQE